MKPLHGNYTWFQAAQSLLWQPLIVEQCFGCTIPSAGSFVATSLMGLNVVHKLSMPFATYVVA